MATSVITRMREHPKTLQVLILITLILTFAANLYGLLTGVTTVIPHLFYIPIILVAFFYPRRGVYVAIALSVAYLLMVVAIFPGESSDLISAAARCIVYIVVAAVISFLSERVNIRERAFVQAKEEWERTFDAVPDLIAIIGMEHRILRINRAMAKSLGISPEKAIGLKCYDVVHRSKIPPQICPHAMLLKDGQEHAIEVHEDNLGGDFYVTTSPVYGEDGALIGSVHIAHDITARKKIELALSESIEKYRTLVESSFDGIAIHQGGILVYVNQTAARILGSEDPAVFIGKPAIETVAPAFRKRIAERVQQASERNLGLIREKFLRLDGSLIDVDVTTAPSLWDGRPAAYVTFRDITAQVRTEDALRKSEENYRAIIENIEDVFFRVDEEDRLVMLSPSAAQTFGYASAAEMLGMPVLSLWKYPEQRSEFFERMKTQSGAVKDWEAEFVKSDGTAFWVSISAHLLTAGQGGYAGSEGIIRDISGRKKMEEALKNALNKLNMLSSITRHDILNQIAGLRMFLELSREDLKGTKHEAFIEKEDRAAEAIQRQIEFTKFYQDIGVNAPKWQDPAAVIHEAAAQLNLPGIDLSVTIMGVEIFADPLIVKVFFNLMENSLRHGERVTTMEFSSRKSEAGLVITYRDNGIGISEEDKKKLFRKGFGRNTGLGLFLSREILAITGITITENGKPGKGVRFDMTVPPGGFRFKNPVG
jgi:PAS domain S-box-containing protein